MNIYPATAARPILKSGVHDPDSILDYGFDYTDWLESGETIATSQWFADPDIPGVTLGSGAYADTNNGIISKVWVVAVDPSVRRFTLTNRIVTNNSPPRTDDFSMIIYVGQK